MGIWRVRAMNHVELDCEVLAGSRLGLIVEIETVLELARPS